MKIVLSIVLAVLFMGCGDDVTKEVQKVEPKKVEKVAPIVEKVEEKKVAVIQKTIAPVRTKTGKDIFQTCAACHGSSAEKAALGKSQIIKGWGTSKVEQALNGYKDGTYGGAMKGVMKAQASKLGKQDIKLVADYISKL
jgi:cytochrome c553